MSTGSRKADRLLLWLFLGVELLCYFVLPVWRVAEDTPGRYKAAALLVIHLVLLYYLLSIWLAGGTDGVAIARRWTCGALASTAGIVLALVLVGFGVLQLHLMRWPITSGPDEPVQVSAQLAAFAGFGVTWGSLGRAAFAAAAIVVLSALLVWQHMPWRDRAAGWESCGRVSWRDILVLVVLAAVITATVREVPMGWLQCRWPPLGTIISVVSYALLGTNEVSSRLPALLFYLATGLYVFRITAAVGDKWVAVLAAMLCLAFPVFFQHGHLAARDSGGAFFVTVGIFYALRHAYHGGSADVALVALAAVLGYFERQTALVLVPIVPLGLLLSAKLGPGRPCMLAGRKALRSYGGALVVIGWMILPWAYVTRDIRPYAAHIANWTDFGLVTAYARVLPEAVGWPGTVLLLIGVAVAFLRRGLLDWLTLSWLGIVYAFFTTDDPYWIPHLRFLTHLCPGIAIAAVTPLVANHTRRTLGQTTAALLIAAVGLYTLASWWIGAPLTRALPEKAPTLLEEPYYPFDQVAWWFREQGVRRAVVTFPAFWQTALVPYLTILDLPEGLTVRGQPACPHSKDVITDAPHNLDELWERCQNVEADYLVVPELPDWSSNLKDRLVGPREYALIEAGRAPGFDVVRCFSGHHRRLLLCRITAGLPRRHAPWSPRVGSESSVR